MERSTADHDDSLRLLGDRLARALPALRALVDETNLMGGPVSASDAAGAVHVIVTAGGLPSEIRVADDWRRTVGVDGLAAAVTEACRQASAARDDLVRTAMRGRRWTDRAAETFGYLAGNHDSPPDRPLDVGEPGSPASAGPSALLAAFVEAGPPDDVGNPTLADHVGMGAFGQLRLTLSGVGAVTCDADPSWLNRAETSGVNDALATALAALHESLDGAQF